MQILPLINKINNSKLYFSKIELSKILACYSIGVSKGSWKDYAISYGKKETSFYMFKHSFSSPDCVLTKTKKKKKNIFNLEIKNKKESKFEKIDDLIILLKRREFKII